MRARRSAVSAIALGAALVLGPGALHAQDTPRGKEVYDRWCAGCHGEDGRGEGPGAGTMLPRPRDFTRALYQIRSTPSGDLPTDADILYVIDKGMPGTAMPGWERELTRAERNDLVDYLKSLSRFFEGATPQPMDFGRAPRVSDDRIAEGREIYRQLECWQCHGDAGRGDGSSAPTLEDDLGLPVAARDLTRPWLFDGGGRVEDIYRRLRTGLDGTPMATFEDAIDAGIISDDQMWSLAHYVRSLSPSRTPPLREVIGAELLEEGVPTSVDDERWQDVERYYVPLAGQIIVMPRWYHPRVDGIWVQAAHDRQELALRVSWTDPSRSPDPAWLDYATGVREAMEPREDGVEWEPGAPDQLMVQFPLQIPRGLERPYFFHGDPRRPVELWRWRSDRSGAEELVGTGPGAFRPKEGSSGLQADAAWSEGEWRVLLRRPLATSDPEADLQFPMARSVPVAFQAWDGDNGEAGLQGSVSTWYFVQLTERTAATVYAAPVLALILTAAFGLMAVSRAQKREREGGVRAPFVNALEGAEAVEGD